MFSWLLLCFYVVPLCFAGVCVWEARGKAGGLPGHRGSCGERRDTEQLHFLSGAEQHLLCTWEQESLPRVPSGQCQSRALVPPLITLSCNCFIFFFCLHKLCFGWQEIWIKQPLKTSHKWKDRHQFTSLQCNHIFSVFVIRLVLPEFTGRCEIGQWEADEQEAAG